jgi:hypothetical protein
MPPWEPFRSTTPIGGPQNPARLGHTQIVSMLTISSKPRKIPFKSALALSFVMLAWMSGAACSNSSPSEVADSGTGDASLPNCESVASVTAYDELPTGSCTGSSSCVENACAATYTCQCNGSWSCTITSGGTGLAGCEVSPEPVVDSGSDVTVIDASDASDDADAL